MRAVVVAFVGGAAFLVLGIFVFHIGDLLSFAAAALMGILLYGFSRFA